MAEAAKDQDQSMEDILQSIKRIIAEEGEPVSAPDSDVLELTELLADDGSISLAKSDERPAVETVSIEEIMAAPISSAPAPVPQPEPVVETPAAPVVDDESLISGATLSGSVAALNALRDSLTPPVHRSTELPLRSGVTVEELVLETLKPMLKDWLDTNLQGLVETLVQKEINRLNPRG